MAYLFCPGHDANPRSPFHMPTLLDRFELTDDETEARLFK